MSDATEAWDPADVVAELDEGGALEFEHDVDAIIELHESLEAAGFDPNSSETYRLMVATGMLIAGTAAYEEEDEEDYYPDFEVACDVISRIAARCYRDLSRNGG